MPQNGHLLDSCPASNGNFHAVIFIRGRLLVERFQKLLECFQHFFADVRKESLNGLNLNFAHGAARHDDAVAALGNVWRFINESIEAVLLKFSANSLSDLCMGGVHDAEAYHKVFALCSPQIVPVLSQ